MVGCQEDHDTDSAWRDCRRAGRAQGVGMRSLSDVLRNFLQLGYVTDDIDGAAAYLESSMGTGRCVKSYASSLGGGRTATTTSGPNSCRHPTRGATPTRTCSVCIRALPRDRLTTV
jgi:hypothetical protein